MHRYPHDFSPANGIQIAQAVGSYAARPWREVRCFCIGKNLDAHVPALTLFYVGFISTYETAQMLATRYHLIKGFSW